SATLESSTAWLIHPSSPGLSVKIDEGGIEECCSLCFPTDLQVAQRAARETYTGPGSLWLQEDAPSGSTPSPADLWVDTSDGDYVAMRWVSQDQQWVQAADANAVAVINASNVAIAQNNTNRQESMNRVYIAPGSDNSTTYAAQQTIHAVVGSKYPVVV